MKEDRGDKFSIIVGSTYKTVSVHAKEIKNTKYPPM
jgi:hypothetical protein